MIVNDSTRFPSGLRHTSHKPAKSKRLLALEVNPHRDLALSFFAPLIETVSGIMQRHRVTRDLKEGSSVNVSALAFIIRLPMEGSSAQCGINPQRMGLHSLPPL